MNLKMVEHLVMLNHFIVDSRELFNEVEPQVIVLAKQALAGEEIDSKVLSDIFRLFHSLKGSASFLDLQSIISVTREAEIMLDIFRGGRAKVRPEHAKILIKTCDYVRHALEVLEKDLSDKACCKDSEAVIEILQKTIANLCKEGGFKTIR